MGHDYSFLKPDHDFGLLEELLLLDLFLTYRYRILEFPSGYDTNLFFMIVELMRIIFETWRLSYNLIINVRHIKLKHVSFPVLIILKLTLAVLQ